MGVREGRGYGVMTYWDAKKNKAVMAGRANKGPGSIMEFKFELEKGKNYVVHEAG